MAQITFKVQAFWDSDAEVWVATSDDRTIRNSQ
ncbi:DUF1902 domain-containing protein [Fortiea contorta]|nr:DUF1902 domain-containing protein [Fortiea contorta]